MAGISFNATALQEYQKKIRDQLDIVEDTIIVKMKDEMAIEPAFGKFTEAETAKGTYATNYEKTWQDIQRLKNALKDIDSACTTTLKNYGEAEDNNTTK